MGGKATDASWILSELGVENIALGFAAGDVGRQIDRMLLERGSLTDFVWVKGETRTNIVVVSESGQGQSTLISGGLEISPEDCSIFLAKFHHMIKRAGCVVIGGSVPRDLDLSIYTQLVKSVRAIGVPVIFDASGPSLAAGMEGRPDFAKPNLDELGELSGVKITGIVVAYEQAKRLQDIYSTSFIITLGEMGALAILKDRAYLIPPLKIEVISTAGAGDGVLAGLSACLAQGKSVEDGFRLGFAAAAAVCLTPATADCRRADVECLLPQVQLLPYP